MILVGPSLGSAVAIDFAVNYPEAVCAIQLIYVLISTTAQFVKRFFIKIKFIT